MKKIDLNKHKLFIVAILLLIIFFQLFRIIYSFVFLKEDSHSDEPWSFGLANSYYEPYIFQDADETKMTHNDQWISADVFRDYLTVNPEQRFNYGSVFYNQSKDLHPPLFYAVLHTICSMFPGKYSLWYGFSINIAVFFITQIFLFLLIKKTVNSDITALAGCILYGTSSGAENTYIFVRMYAMATMFAVITSYLHVSLYHKHNLKKYIPLIFITTVLGSLTHHFFLIFAGAVSACFCFYYLFNKKIKHLFIYAVSMLSAVGTSILIFPATINHLFGRRGEILKYEPLWQLKMSFGLVLTENFGIHVSVFKSPVPVIIFIITISSLIILTPLLFLFRNEKWFKKLLCSLKGKKHIIICKIKNKFGYFNFPVLVFFISSLSVILATAFSVSLIDMDMAADRYMFMSFPIICAFFICITHYIIKWSLHGKLIKNIMILLTAFSLSLSSDFTEHFNYHYKKNPDITSCSELLDDSNCIFISNQYWLLTTVCDKFINSDQIYASTPDSFIKNINNISKLDSDKPVYLLIYSSNINSDDESDTSSKSQIITNGMSLRIKKTTSTLKIDELEKTIRSFPIFNQFTYIGYDQIFQRTYLIYRIA